MKQITLFMIFFICITTYAQKFDGLAKTPPMGWNSWNKFTCNVSEKLIREAADAMVSSGMKDAGYTYVNIDDCWQGQRDSLGFIHPDSTRFPSGMKALADYIHSLGLKFGIYTDEGWMTCGGKPGSRGHEYQDAMTYAKWDVDYLKDDYCYTEFLNPKGAYLTMREALYATKRPIVLSICMWGNGCELWAKDVGHLWRTTGDIHPAFDLPPTKGDESPLGVLQILDFQRGLRKYAGPDHWNDPDMLEVGNGMSVGEDRAHFSLWCMMAAPLMSGNDLLHMSKETAEILKNKEAIAVDQDTVGIQGFIYTSTSTLEIWAKPLADGEWAICFFNRGLKEENVNFSWKQHIIIDSLFNREINFKKNKYTIRDLWQHKETGTTEKDFVSAIPSHDVVLLRLMPVN
jgi:alpha-galactosidase